jgi:hypothetical protein
MLIEFGDAFDDSGVDFRAWCYELGFRRFEGDASRRAIQCRHRIQVISASEEN